MSGWSSRAAWRTAAIRAASFATGGIGGILLLRSAMATPFQLQAAFSAVSGFAFVFLASLNLVASETDPRKRWLQYANNLAGAPFAAVVLVMRPSPATYAALVVVVIQGVLVLSLFAFPPEG